MRQRNSNSTNLAPKTQTGEIMRTHTKSIIFPPDQHGNRDAQPPTQDSSSYDADDVQNATDPNNISTKRESARRNSNTQTLLAKNDGNTRHNKYVNIFIR